MKTSLRNFIIILKKQDSIGRVAPSLFHQLSLLLYFLVCNCNAQGSRDNLCEPVTGQCLCQSYIDGRACDTCESGMYNFPNCQRCQCNGHADTCEDKTGNCINCEDYTIGPRCDLCLDGKCKNGVVRSLYLMKRMFKVCLRL